jgi:hypothetical protein
MITSISIAAEQWRDVIGIPDYEVSSEGRVRNKCTGHLLRPWVAGYGYYYLNLGRKNRRTVHSIVAEAFCGSRPSANHEVAHWDGVCTNNRAINLRWATHTENVHDQRRHGTLYMEHGPGMRGDDHPRSKLSSHAVREIREAYNGKRGQAVELAARYCVHPSTIRRAVSGSMWSHVA